MVRRRSFTSISGPAVTGSRSMMSFTFSSPKLPERAASALRSSWNVSMPTIRPCSRTTREPRFSFAMVDTASLARLAGSTLSSRLPLTRRISFTCMTHLPNWRTDWAVPGNSVYSKETGRGIRPRRSKNRVLRLDRLQLPEKRRDQLAHGGVDVHGALDGGVGLVRVHHVQQRVHDL